MPARNAHGTSHQDKAECLGAAVAMDLGLAMYCIYCGKKAFFRCCGELHLVTAQEFESYYGYWPYDSYDEKEQQEPQS
jgi:hypothetical protein